jgi:hypothetical protein
MDSKARTLMTNELNLNVLDFVSRSPTLTYLY